MVFSFFRLHRLTFFYLISLYYAWKMQTFGAFLVTVLAASAELASALPQRMDTVQPRGQGQTLSVPVSHNLSRRKNLKHPALAYAKALRKYNVELPSHVQAVVDRFSLLTKRGDDQGSVAASSLDGDTEYVATISVGTPAQELPMDFDTGSSDLWVMGASNSGTSGHKTYDTSSSSTAKEMSGASWTISYGDGSSSSGTVYKDTVTIGNLTVSDQAVELATKVSSEFTEDSGISGLVGLAMSSINTVQPTAQKTWFDNVKSSLASPLFTADLKHNTKGSYNFGYIDAAAHTGTMYYADLVTSGDYGGFWTFVANGYSVGSSSSGTATGSDTGSSATATATGSSGSLPTSLGASNPYGPSSGSGSSYGGGYGSAEPSSNEGNSFASSGFGGLDSLDSLEGELSDLGFKKAKRASTGTKTTPAKRSATLNDVAITGIADTGTTLLMLPDAAVTAYYKQVSGASDSQQEGGYVFDCSATLPDFTFGVGDGQITIPGDYINFQAVSEGSSTCYGGIQSDSGIGMAIFGDIALKVSAPANCPPSPVRRVSDLLC